jgi:undecaprenyl-diphosphatase
MVVAVCAAAFVALALVAALAESALLRIDRPIQEWVVAERRGWLNDVMRWVSLLGTRYVIGALLAGLVAWSWVTGRCRVAVLVLVAAFVLNPLVEFLLKEGVGRVRPDLLPLGRRRGPSFPSGHVVASVGFYGVLPALAWEATSRHRLRVLSAIAAVAVIVGVGVSRVYVGVHWPTDVLGGFLVGTIIVLATARALRGHRLDRSGCCRPAPTDLVGVGATSGGRAEPRR